MNKNISSLNFSFCFYNKGSLFKQYETTYKSTYGKFYDEENKSRNSNIYTPNRSINYQPIFLRLNQTKNNIPNWKLICPNCINENIIKVKSHSKIKRLKKKEIDFFGDKMKLAHEKKMKSDIMNREERAKQTYHSLYVNRGRRNENYIKISNDISREGEYFGKDIEYGMIRCRNREINNDKNIFGIDLKNRLKNSKSWIGNNYLLDKTEYNEIINKQIKSKIRKNKREKCLSIKEEKELLFEQLQNEKNKIKEEKEKKNYIRNEINKINSIILKEKKNRENCEKRRKMKEKEYISNICKQQIEEFIQNLKMKKIKNQKYDDDNFKIALIRNKKSEIRKFKTDKNFYGLPLKGIENKKCEQCKREYPKNVMSQICYSYNEQQKKKYK